MARPPKFAYVVDKLLEDFSEELSFEIAEEHMPMESDAQDAKFHDEYQKALKYAHRKIEKMIQS
jgi:hypothetical protein